MSGKRGRKSSFWGHSFFKKTKESNASGNPLHQCQVPTGKDKDDKDILCCELVAYSGSPTNLKAHLQGRHREWYAKMKAEKIIKNEKKQQKLDVHVEVKEKIPSKGVEERRAANEEEKAQLDEDLLSYVVDDLRGVSSVEGLIYVFFIFSILFKFLFQAKAFIRSRHVVGLPIFRSRCFDESMSTSSSTTPLLKKELSSCQFIRSLRKIEVLPQTFIRQRMGQKSWC